MSKNHFRPIENKYSHFKSKIFYDNDYNGYLIDIYHDRTNRVIVYWSCFFNGFNDVNNNKFQKII